MQREQDHHRTMPLGQCHPTTVWANHFAFSPGQQEGPWAAASRMLLYVRSGRGIAWRQGRSAKLVRGDCCWLDWGEPIRYEADERDPFSVLSCHFILHYDPTWPAPPFRHLNSYRREYQGEAGDVHVPELEPIARQGNLLRMPHIPLMMERLAEEMARPTVVSRSILSAYAKAILAELAASAAQSPPATPHPRMADVLRVRQYLDINFKEPLTREWMAEMAGMSPAHFTRAFRAVTGTTPHQFLLTRRLSEVQSRLRMSSAGLKQIAIETGFRDEFHLSHAFKKAFGISPREYRRQASSA